MTKRKENSLIKKKKNWGVAAVILLAGILLLFAVLFFLQEKNNQENNSQSSAIKAMVYMENNGVGGNGSIYQITEEEVIIVTTYHLLQNGELIKVRFRDNFYAEGSILGVNEEHDVGFVTVPTEEISDETLRQIGSIQKDAASYEALKQGDLVKYYFLTYDGIFVCQESYEGTIGDMNWYVADFDDYLIYNYCQVQPGMSGCAAVAEDGSYIGMVIGGYDNESAALSVQVIDKVYQELVDFTKS